MGFASAWLEEKALFPVLFEEQPDKNTGIIIVVPAYGESEIIRLLESLNSCSEPPCKSEVIIIVNAPHFADNEIIAINERSIAEIEVWRKNNSDSSLKIHCHNAGRSSLRDWGVGMARKTGMDEALRRFSSIDRPGGLIVCLDADCTVSENYLTALFEDAIEDQKCKACNIGFEHPVSGDDFPPDIYRNIALYELHLRYVRQALVYTGFPYPLHTIGSAMAVKAETYMRAGGMNRRQAGEDFYFIQKIVQMGGFREISKATVYPSPRQSFRVPFGTGAAISKMKSNNEDEFLSYNFSSFNDLKEFFSSMARLSEEDRPLDAEIFERLPATVNRFISFGELKNKTDEIRVNTSGAASFRKRFFNWFNMFRIVKYLNNSADSAYPRVPVVRAATDLLKASGYEYDGNLDQFGLLEYFRELDRTVIIRFP